MTIQKNSSTINKTFIIGNTSTSGETCNPVYTNLIEPCSGDTIEFTGNISLTGAIIAETISGSTLYSNDINLTGGITAETISTTTLYSNDISLTGGVTANTISATTFYGDGSNLSGVSSNNTYTNTGATPTTVAGIPAGSTFVEQTMQDMWDKLLYPYQNPGFSSFYINGWTSSRYEVGVDIPVNQTFRWSTSNSGNVKPDTIQISGYNLVTLPGLSNDGTETVVFTGVIGQTGIGTRAWTILGTNTNNINFSRSLSIRWDWIQYWGQSSNTSLIESEIKALVSSRITPSGVNGSYAFPALGYKYFCFADQYSGPSSFVDSGTGFGVAMYGGYPYSQNGVNYDLVSITNSYGKTVNYRVYRTQNELGGSITMTIS